MRTIHHKRNDYQVYSWVDADLIRVGVWDASAVPMRQLGFKAKVDVFDDMDIKSMQGIESLNVLVEEAEKYVKKHF